MPDHRSPAFAHRVVALFFALSGLALTLRGQQTEAENLIAAGHWKKARAIVEARLRQSPEDPLSTFLLSQIRYAFGDDSTPRILAEKAVRLDSRVAKYHRQLAETLGVEARRANPVQLIFIARQFRRELDTAIALDPRDLQAQRDLLEYYLVAPGLAGGDMEKASATAEHIAQLDTAEGFLAQARVARAGKQASQVGLFLHNAAAQQPPRYRAQVELADFVLSGSSADLAAAELAAKTMLALDPARAEPYTTLARIYVRRSDLSALDALLAESARRVPDDFTPFFSAAEALLKRAVPDTALAERYLRVYLSQEPEGNAPSLSEARLKLDLALRAQGRRTTATGSKPTGSKQ